MAETALAPEIAAASADPRIDLLQMQPVLTPK
jgi:hypothetical protein